MKWRGENIKDLSDFDLLAAQSQLEKMHEFKEKQHADPKFKKRFENQPMPTVNPVFEALQLEIQNEIENRKLNNVHS